MGAPPPEVIVPKPIADAVTRTHTMNYLSRSIIGLGS